MVTLLSNLQKLCVEAPSVSLEELGEDEGEAGAAEKRGRERTGCQQPVHVHALGKRDPRRRQHQIRCVDELQSCKRD